MTPARKEFRRFLRAVAKRPIRITDAARQEAFYRMDAVVNRVVHESHLRMLADIEQEEKNLGLR